MATIYTYDLNGKKLSFANWISNLTPTETPFVSMTGKEAISQVNFQWQTDYIDTPDANNAAIEGSKAVDPALRATTVISNTTQILRQVVSVSDTANVLANYGRGRELQYQMEKAGKEIKRDLENAFLTQKAKVAGTSSTARKTAGFQGLVAVKDSTDPDTGAKVNFDVATANRLVESDLFAMTYNMYLVGSHADTIMFHPKHANFFASLMESTAVGTGIRVKMYESSDVDFNHYVDTVVDPLGTQWKLIPNRFMPEDALYFFSPNDWTQMVLRAPARTKLAKEGSYEKWMIEMEVGLRHRNPFASGVLTIKTV